jgi:hypothetical protein
MRSLPVTSLTAICLRRLVYAAGRYGEQMKVVVVKPVRTLERDSAER